MCNHGDPVRAFRLALLIGGMLALVASPVTSQVNLTKIEVNPSTPGIGSSPAASQEFGKYTTTPSFTELAGEWYFTASTPATGRELYKTDGTPGGTQLVIDLNPGPASSGIYEMSVAGGRLFFNGSDGVVGDEMWSTTGTAATTQLEFDLMPGAAGSGPEWLLGIGSVLYYSARDPVLGMELVVIDTTGAVAPLVIDITKGPWHTYLQNMIAHPQGAGVLFDAVDNVVGAEMWTSDGTVQGTKPVTNFGEPSPPEKFHQPIAFAGGVLFVGAELATGPEVYFSDGTAGGEILLADITPGIHGSEIILYQQGVFGNLAYFEAFDPVIGPSLFQTDGTPGGTHLAFPQTPTSPYGAPIPLGIAGGKMLFSAVMDVQTIGGELYALEAGGLVLVKDLEPGLTAGHPIWSSPTDAIHIGGKLIFSTKPLSGQSRLWITDGTTAGTLPLDTMTHKPKFLTSIGGSGLIFSGGHEDVGQELFFSAGVPGTSIPLADLHPGSTLAPSFPSRLVCLEGQDLYFQALTGLQLSLAFSFFRWSVATGVQKLADVSSHGPLRSVWIDDHKDVLFSDLLSLPGGVVPAVMHTDGSAQGTSVLHASPLGAEIDYGDKLVGSDGQRTYFSAWDHAHGFELWSTDGTPEGTSLFKDLKPGQGYSEPGPGVFFNGFLFFPARLGNFARALWRTDGTVDGTLGTDKVNVVSGLVVAGRTMFFAGYDSAHGTELWASNGTAGGTALLRDIVPGSAGSGVSHLTAAGNLVYFFASDPASTKRSIWISDGTKQGTKVVQTLTADLDNYSFLLTTDQGVFFKDTGPNQSMGLWFFDGSTSTFLHDFAPVIIIEDGPAVVVSGGRLYFTGTDAVGGREPFVSDGTAAGTHMLVDVRPGSAGSDPNNFCVCGGGLLFAAAGADGDREIYRVDLLAAHVIDMDFGGPGAKLSASVPALGQAMQVSVVGSPPGSLGVLSLSPAVPPSSILVGQGFASWIDPLNFTILAASSAVPGIVSHAIPLDPTLAGLQLNMQAWFFATGPAGPSTSNGLRLVLGQ